MHPLPVVQANLNHSPVPSLGGKAPVEVFTGLPASSPLAYTVIPGTSGTIEVSMEPEAIAQKVERLRESLRDMHIKVSEIRDRRRQAARSRSSGAVCNFSVGNFVLWSRIDKWIRGTKLMARWIGPFRVVEALQHSFMVEHLLTADRYEVHGSRLKYYCDADLEVTTVLREHVAGQGIVLGVRGIEGHRKDPTSTKW